MTLPQLSLILIAFSSASGAVTCNWFNGPAYQGVIPAFVTPGIQNVSYSTANLQWQCSGLSSGTLATHFRINYGPTTSYGNIYNYAPANVPGTVSDNRPVGGTLAGLSASTTYHVQGQSCVGGTDNLCTSGNWYSTPDLSFTTTSAPIGQVLPTIPPLPINLAIPTMSGNHWIYGSNCGTTSGSTAAIVTANIQACLNLAIPGDDIAFAPGIYPILQVFYPDQGKSITCLATTTTCTVGSGSAPATGSQIIISPNGGLNPINQGYPYYVVGSSGTTFSLAATLGGSAITFSSSSNSGTEYVPYPYDLTKSITIHSTASASNLPPLGTKLACSDLTQYAPYMPIFQLEDPTVSDNGQAGAFAFNSMSSGYYHLNIGIQVDLTTANGSLVDPPGFGLLFGPGYGASGSGWANQNVGYNQIFFQVKLPSRSQSISLDGINNHIINSCIDAGNWWQPTYYNATNLTPSSSGQTYSQPSVVWSWPGTSGVKSSVTSVAGSFTITGGTSTGNVTTWVNPVDGTNHAQIPSGLTYTSSNITVHQYAAPIITVNTTGSTTHTYNCIPINVQVGMSDTVTITNSASTPNNTVTCTNIGGATNYWVVRDGSVIGANSSGVFTDTGQVIYNAGVSLYTPTAVFIGTGTGVTRSILSSTGLNLGQWTVTSGTLDSFAGGNILLGGGYGRNQIGQGINGGQGYGPVALENNDIVNGVGIVGYFGSDGFIHDTACGSANPCVTLYTPGQITIKRNYFQSNPLANQFNPNWDGQWVDGRNQYEKKIGTNILIDGNIFDGIISSAGTGQCALNYYISNNSPWLGYALAIDNSNWSFTNNTCLNMGAGVVIGANNNTQGDQTVLPQATTKNILIKNNLILNTLGGNGGWKTANPYAPPSGVHYQYSNSGSGCPNSYSFIIGTLTENTILDHNTVRNSNGCFPQAVWFDYNPVSGFVTNNIFEWTSDNAGAYGLVGPTIYQNVSGDNYDIPNCSNNGALAMIANGCAPQLTWGGNLFLPTYADTFPGTGNQEFTSGQITGGINSVPSGLWATYANGSTGAARLAWMKYFNTNSLVSGGFSLTPTSPAISGAKVSTDGKDIGIDSDKLAVAQGQVSNVRVISTTSTSAKIVFYAPDSFACGVDWGTTAFYNGTGTWTRVAGSAGSPNPRIQMITLSGLPSDSLIYYRLNCATYQPTGTIQLP